jgi:DNA polymerase III subunit gamma/tau
VTDLTEKYRPRRFSQIVGQARAVGWMRAQIRSSERQSVLLAGPFGTGKSSCGLIYARAALCELPQDGEPCDQCESCREFDLRGEDSLNFHFLKCGEAGTIDKIQELLERARMAPYAADRRVFMLDEAHNLSWRAVQGLLDMVEFPPKWVMFIIATSNHDELPGSLLSRLQIQELELLDRAHAFDFLADICRKEELTFEPSALELISSAVIGSPRFLLRALGKVRDWGAITESNVRLSLKLDVDHRLASYTAALLNGEIARQLDLIEAWPDTPTRKLAFLYQFFTFVYLSELRRIERDDAVLRTISQGSRVLLVEAFANRAGHLGLDEERYWEGAIAALEPREGISASQLLMVLTKFDRLINQKPSDVGRDPSAPTVTPAPQKRLRILRNNVATSDIFHSWQHVKPFWEIGSFLPQCLGALFNFRLTIAHDLSGPGHHDDGANLVSSLTRQLTARVTYRAPQAQCHWIYQHEVDAHGALVSRILMAVPQEQFGYAHEWLGKFASGRNFASRARLSISSRKARMVDEQLRFHWRGVRALSRCLSPAECARNESGAVVPLVELLKIPERWRGPVGKLHTSQGKGMSKWLTSTARKACVEDMPILSALGDRAWSQIDRDWVLKEYKARRREWAKRQEAVARLTARFAGEDELSRARRSEELKLLESSFRMDAKLRARPWAGWWQSSLKNQ